VPVKEFPILSFRYKVEEGDPLGHGAWIWVTWEDARGKEYRNLIWNEGISREWTEVNIDLEAFFNGYPIRIKRIELNNQDPPHITLWDWIKLCKYKK
jgi:hypothetical protein